MRLRLLLPLAPLVFLACNTAQLTYPPDDLADANYDACYFDCNDAGDASDAVSDAGAEAAADAADAAAPVDAAADAPAALDAPGASDAPVDGAAD